MARHCDDHNQLPNHVPVRDATGVFTTVSAHGSIALNNEFFQDLGSNGRRCVSCHVPAVGWTITPGQRQRVFEATDGGAFEDGLGLGAVFRTNDGSNSPRADVSTKAKRREAYSMLLDRASSASAWRPKQLDCYQTFAVRGRDPSSERAMPCRYARLRAGSAWHAACVSLAP